MTLQEDAIIDIKENQIKFFGTSGKMLLPSQATVEAVIQKVPPKKLITTDLLRKKLAEQFHVQGTCPVTTKKALIAIANEKWQTAPYWRVIKKNGEIMSYFPGGVDGHAKMLIREGFEIITSSKVPKVKDYRRNLFDFR